ncbi:MAG: DUF1700 domain-containing protein [Ruminococcus sp.]|nr:DUF1700 domain-containing protein [Ruminococcus sp.]
MTKQQFISELRAKLSGMPKADLEDSILYYRKKLDSITDNGYTEDAAAAQVGDTDEIVDGILCDYPLSKIVMEKLRSSRKLKAWEAVLLILGSPVWISLLIAVLAVVFSAYFIVCAVVVSMWVISASFEVVSLIVTAWSVLIVIRGEISTGIAVFGAGLFGVGFSILIFFGGSASTKGLRALTRKVLFSVKKRLVGIHQAPKPVHAVPADA